MTEFSYIFVVDNGAEVSYMIPIQSEFAELDREAFDIWRAIDPNFLQDKLTARRQMYQRVTQSLPKHGTAHMVTAGREITVDELVDHLKSLSVEERVAFLDETQLLKKESL